MANLLKMANVQSILLLHAQGWTQRRIARELGIDRETVRKYPKPANLPMVPALGPKPADVPIGWIAESAAPKPANAPTGSTFPAGPRSKCEPHREVILAKMQEGLTAQRIYQDLGGAEAGLGYDSVRRFLRRIGGKRALPFPLCTSPRGTHCKAGSTACACVAFFVARL